MTRRDRMRRDGLVGGKCGSADRHCVCLAVATARLPGGGRVPASRRVTTRGDCARNCRVACPQAGSVPPQRSSPATPPSAPTRKLKTGKWAGVQRQGRRRVARRLAIRKAMRRAHGPADGRPRSEASSSGASSGSAGLAPGGPSGRSTWIWDKSRLRSLEYYRPILSKATRHFQRCQGAENAGALVARAWLRARAAANLPSPYADLFMGKVFGALFLIFGKSVSR